MFRCRGVQLNAPTMHHRPQRGFVACQTGGTTVFLDLDNMSSPPARILRITIDLSAGRADVSANQVIVPNEDSSRAKHGGQLVQPLAPRIVIVPSEDSLRLRHRGDELPLCRV